MFYSEWFRKTPVNLSITPKIPDQTPALELSCTVNGVRLTIKNAYIEEEGDQLVPVGYLDANSARLMAAHLLTLAEKVDM